MKRIALAAALTLSTMARAAGPLPGEVTDADLKEGLRLAILDYGYQCPHVVLARAKGDGPRGLDFKVVCGPEPRLANMRQQYRVTVMANQRVLVSIWSE